MSGSRAPVAPCLVQEICRRALATSGAAADSQLNPIGNSQFDPMRDRSQPSVTQERNSKVTELAETRTTSSTTTKKRSRLIIGNLMLSPEGFAIHHRGDGEAAMSCNVTFRCFVSPI